MTPTLLFLSTADTDLLAIERALPATPAIAPAVELGNPARPGTLARVNEHLDPLRTKRSCLDGKAAPEPGRGLQDTGGQERCHATTMVLVLRLHGGRRAAPELFAAVEAAVNRHAMIVIALAGEAQPDPELAALCQAPADVVEHVKAYLRHGGVANAAAMLRYLSDTFWGTELGYAPPLSQPEDGIYCPGYLDATGEPRCNDRQEPAHPRPRVGILFYRAHWLSGNLDFVDALVRALDRHGCAALPVFCGSLRLPTGAAPESHVLARYFLDERGQPKVDAVVSTLSFASGRLSTPTIGEVEGATEAGGPTGEWLARLGVPVLQAIVCADSRATWEARAAGLSPVDVAMQVALPEFDGRIVTVPICFKEVASRTEPISHTARSPERELVKRPDAHTIRYVPDEERCDALARQAAAWARLRRRPSAEKRVAVVLGNYPSRNGRIGNAVGLDTPASLVRLLQSLDSAGYTVGRVPETGDALIHRLIEAGTYDPESGIDTGSGDPPGLRFGNVFVGLQPPRGWETDPDAVYHDPELAPPPVYVAFYRWLRAPPPTGFGADAVIHLGKHGTLEWLPGKAVGLSAGCAPDALLGDVPLIYPFIVDDPGEGTQAKRRAHAVLVGHMVPPLTQAGLYGELAELERLIQEERAARLLDPPKLPLLQRKILETVHTARLHEDLAELNQLLDEAVREASISHAPPATGVPPLPRAERGIGEEVHPTSTFDRLLARLEAHLANLRSATIRDGLHILGTSPTGEQRRTTLDAMLQLAPADKSDALRAHLEPLLDRTQEELGAVLTALGGGFVPTGPSGAPTRGAWNVLPTGRNFYAVDPHAIPSRTAWETGCRLASALLERHLHETGRYPHTVGLVVWGTATMRTHGDDVAQALALLGVRPVWQAETGRVITIEPISAAELGRPRVDVTLHISGFFRDAFPHLVALLDRAVQLVADLEEPAAVNFVAANVRRAADALVEAGDVPASARRRASYRLFGSKPGCYGAGLLPLIDSRRWHTPNDLAQAYETWTAFAYGQDAAGEPARGAFRARFAAIEVAAKNQDNREHDLFDSDDYFQYHGGMVAAVRTLRGEAPRAYFGDSSDPARPAMRSLHEEARRVFRTRVVNPRWLAAMRRHGYKGAFELAATVDYLFGYDATAGIADDPMYERVAQAYALAPEQQAFFACSNPWALRDVAERLLEAAERGLWQHPTPETLDALRRVYLQVDGDLEGEAARSGATT